MLLVHQAGSVHVGETIRYTITYTPSADRILPSPAHLYVKIKNTSPLPLRAAYLHGPYSLYVAAYSSTFNPNRKVEEADKYGIPEFEPFLKAGAQWTCKLNVPEDIRETGDTFAASGRGSIDSEIGSGDPRKSVTWIVEVQSQIIFSNSAVVHFEVLVGRDERSLELGFASAAGHGHGGPGQVADHKRADRKRDSRSGQKGVYSRAVRLKAEDTADLWNKPKLPDSVRPKTSSSRGEKSASSTKDDGKKNQQKVHLVVLTHGLHSNLNADMLYLKESIDATVALAREERRGRKSRRASHQDDKSPRTKGEHQNNDEGKEGDAPASTAPLSGGQEDADHTSNDDDDEQVIVRGFSGNAIRTERGIQYLGKRLAKFILDLTYPSQPYLPVKKSMSQSFSSKFSIQDKKTSEKYPPSHHGSTIHRDTERENYQAYRFTSISFVGHSLGGLIQMYAIAYIQKHAPGFFKVIQPINFICLASPLLGLSNENPMYVKFALDFGLVGRTGQDLGLTWRAPTIAKSGWRAMGGVFGAGSKEHKEDDPGAKPLLRILPTGPAHQVLHLFRNRTVYSNVVNDGIVPLRTSCLLFLDWKGLGKVQKARRENGLIGTMAEWGWAELTGANAERDLSVSPNPSTKDFQGSDGSPTRSHHGESVPQPAEGATEDDNKASGLLEPTMSQYMQPRSHNRNDSDGGEGRPSTSGSTSSVLDGFLSFFRPGGSSDLDKKSSSSPKALKALRRGQTLTQEQEDAASAVSPPSPVHTRPELSRGTTDNPTMRPAKSRPTATRGDTVEHTEIGLAAPPKTSVFESASDILHPPIPSTQFIIDPTSRPRAIFHDRVYHPSDIPPPPTRRPSRLPRTFSSDQSGTVKATKSGSPAPSLRRTDSQTSISSAEGGMKVEEKIARAYHRDLSWRKVLVKLEPDAHNNMIVRRMFANAYGWPVVKHLCDTHFGDTFSAQTRDENESGVDRAAVDQSSKTSKDPEEPVPDKAKGEEVKGQTDKAPPLTRHDSELREVADELTSLDKSTAEVSALDDGHKHRHDTDNLTDHFFSGSDSDDDDSVYQAGPDLTEAEGSGKGAKALHLSTSSKRGDGRRTPDIFLSPSDVEGHLTTEPDSLEGSEVGSAVSPSTILKNVEDVKGKKATRPASPGDVGLKRDVNEAMTQSVMEHEEGKDAGVLERVAGVTAAMSPTNAEEGAQDQVKK